MGWLGSSSSSGSKEPTTPLSPTADPNVLLGAVVPAFIKSMPLKAESGKRPKVEVNSELVQRKDEVKAKLRAAFEKNKVVRPEHLEELLSKLDEEMANVIHAYLKSCAEVACKAARDATTAVLPKGFKDVGIALPAAEPKVADAIERKKAAVRAELAQQLDRFHASWYGDVVFPEVDKEVDAWGDTVRGAFACAWRCLPSGRCLSLFLPPTPARSAVTGAGEKLGRGAALPRGSRAGAAGGVGRVIQDTVLRARHVPSRPQQQQQQWQQQWRRHQQ